MKERELLALVEAAPMDADAIAVYADFLEETGDARRAEFLRLQQALRGMRTSHPQLLARGRALHALGKTLPRRWVAAVTAPKLAGTAWTGRDDAGFFICRFRPRGRLNYSQPVGTYENGTWEQVGATVAMETNAHYADYFGVIVGDTLRGRGRNVAGHAWAWKLTRSEDPAVTEIPDGADRSVFRRPRAPHPRRISTRSR